MPQPANDVIYHRDEMSLDEVYDKFGELATFKELFYDWVGFNKWLFLKINGIRQDTYDVLMQCITQLGDRHNFPQIMVGLAVVGLLMGLVKKVRKRGGVKPFLICWFGALAVIGAGFLGNAAVIYTMKDHFALPRPYVALAATPTSPGANVHQLEVRKPEDANRSFPSGHAAFITLLVAGLWPMLNERMRYVGGFLIFAVGWSRVSLGVHFPADVVWGFLIALLIVMVARAVVYKLLRIIGLNCA